MRHSPSCEQGFTAPERQDDGEGRRRVHDELVACADVKTERPFFTRASQRQCLREATRGRCVSGARAQRRQSLPRKGREDSSSSARPVNQTVRNWSSSAR